MVFPATIDLQIFLGKTLFDEAIFSSTRREGVLPGKNAA